jgi:hypothetical protein
MSEQHPGRELAALEATLASLTPRPAALDRDALFFHAGQASLRRRGRMWAGVSAALACVSAALGGSLLLRPAPEPIERIVYVPIKEAAPQAVAVERERTDETAAPSGPTADHERARLGYYQLQRHVLRWGIEGLPATSARQASPLAPPRRPGGSSLYQLRNAYMTGEPL